MTKICSRCRQEKDIKHFSRRAAEKDGHNYYCKECKKIYDDEYHRTHREERKNWELKHSKERREQARIYHQSPIGKYNAYRNKAKSRGIDWTLTMEEFSGFWQNPCSYCGDKIDTIGLDRVNNQAGYSAGNIVSCCIKCNIAKNDMGLSEFQEWLGRIAQHYLRNEIVRVF